MRVLVLNYEYPPPLSTIRAIRGRMIDYCYCHSRSLVSSDYKTGPA
jgi:hypothetical protein